MARDPSYAAYVDARWPMLYRLATLLVGEEQAGALTESALVTAYLRWADAQAAASTDEHVQGVLARTAVDDFATERPQGEGLAALPTRQRAVLVLRCFELLGAAEVAAALGGKAAEVEQDEAAALATLRLSRPELAEELAHEAEATSVPPAPLDDLLARGGEQLRRHRGRTLRRSGAVGLVVLAALVVASLASSARDGAPEPARIPTALAQLPTGGPPRSAYSDGLTLQLPGGPLILSHHPVALLQAGDWVYLTYASGMVEQVGVRSLDLTPLTPPAAGQVVADTSGRWVAWLEPGSGGRPPVVAARAAGADTSPLHQQPFPRGTGPLVVNGMTRSGDLVASRPAENRAWVWHTGLVSAPGRPQVEEISGLGNGGVGQVAGDDLVLGHALYFAAGDLRDGTFFVEDELEARQADFSDPLGTRVLYVDAEGRVLVRPRASGGRPQPGPAVRLGSRPESSRGAPAGRTRTTSSSTSATARCRSARWCAATCARAPARSPSASTAPTCSRASPRPRRCGSSPAWSRAARGGGRCRAGRGSGGRTPRGARRRGGAPPPAGTCTPAAR